jgi:hypothetical protein
MFVTKTQEREGTLGASEFSHQLQLVGPEGVVNLKELVLPQNSLSPHLQLLYLHQRNIFNKFNTMTTALMVCSVKALMAEPGHLKSA